MRLVPQPSVVVWIPGAPVLVPEVATGAAGEVAAIRSAALDALRALSLGCSTVVIVGAGPAASQFPPGSSGSFEGIGVDLRVQLPTAASPPPAGHVPAGLPLSLLVGGSLLVDALGPDPRVAVRGLAVPTTGSTWSAVPGEPWGLVVVADGSTRRSPGAPGSFHPDALAWDESIASALAAGSPQGLAVLNPGWALAVGCADATVWRWAGAALDSGWDAELALHDAPMGVGYFVATWRARE